MIGTKVELQNAIDNGELIGKIFCFCTNTMLGRGRVWHCQVQQDNRLICVDREDWMGMAFAPLETEPFDFGTLTVKQISGSLKYTLAAKNAEGKIIQFGRG